MPDPELRARTTLPPSAGVSKPQIEAGMSVRQHAQDSKIPRFERWNLRNLRNLGWNLGKNRFTSALASCYIGSVAPVKRDRDWSPEAISATKAAVSAFGLRLCRWCPFYGGSTGKRKLGRFLARGCPVDRPVELPPRLVSERRFLNRNLLEAIMATSFRAPAPASPATGTAPPLYPAVVHGLSLTDTRCADVLNALPGMADPSPAPTAAHDPIQLHADAHNALAMAVFYLRQPLPDTAAARRKAIQALTALRGLSLALEG